MINKIQFVFFPIAYLFRILKVMYILRWKILSDYE